MSVWKSDEKLLIFASVISLLKSFCLRSNITHSTQCFMTRRDTSKSKLLHCALYFNSLLGVSPGDEHCISCLMDYFKVKNELT